MTDSCSSCRFFRALPDLHNEAGQCRRSPPTIVNYMLRLYSEPSDFVEDCAIEFATNWPITAVSDWCGEWRSTAPVEWGSRLNGEVINLFNEKEPTEPKA